MIFAGIAKALDKSKKCDQKGRKSGSKEKSNVFISNLNESDEDVPLEYQEATHFVVDKLSGVTCVSINYFVMQCIHHRIIISPKNKNKQEYCQTNQFTSVL